MIQWGRFSSFFLLLDMSTGQEVNQNLPNGIQTTKGKPDGGFKPSISCSELNKGFGFRQTLILMN